MPATAWPATPIRSPLPRPWRAPAPLARAGILALALGLGSCRPERSGEIGPRAPGDAATAATQDGRLVLAYDGDGPRTREGARLLATVELATSPAASAEAAREPVRAWLERALQRGGMDAGRAAAASDLAPELKAAGLDLISARVTRLEVPGDAQRAALAPTTEVRIVLVGLDGLDWDIAQPLMDAGRMPALSALAARGTRARLQSIAPILSPVVWTSMATGRRPQDHGILDFLGTDAKGGVVPVTSNLRRVKAFWNVMSDASVETAVVGWWATWPAEPVRGVIVSDRVAYQLFGLDQREPPSAGKVFPAKEWKELEPLVVRPRDIVPRDVEPFLSPSPSRMDAQDKELIEQFAGVLAQSRTYAAIGLHLESQRRPRVGAYYFGATDTAAHLFMRYAPPPLPEIDAGRQQRYRAMVDRVYELHDRILARFVEGAGEHAVVIVASDHGFRSGSARLMHESRVESATAADWHEPQGVLVMAGEGVRRGAELAEASVLDVFPTMLALLGMPVADDLAGRVLEDALEPGFLAAHPLRRVPTFETGPPRADAIAQASPEDRAILEQLVAIGYVSSAALAPGGGSAAGGSGPAGGEAAANMHNNLGTVLLQQGDLEQAEAEFRKVTEMAPGFVAGHVNRAQVLLRLGRVRESEAALKRALEIDPSSARALSLMASLQLEAGRAGEAEKLARATVERDPRSAAGWYTLGQVLERQRRPAEARQAYAKSAELDPDNPEPRNALGNSHEAAGEWAEAARWYEKALHSDPTHGAAYNNLALQQQRLGLLDEALATYERGRRKLPRSSVLLNNLATWHHLKAQRALQSAAGASGQSAAEASRQGRDAAAAAEKLYREAMAANPLDASPVNNLGALMGELGRPDDQLALYRRAVEIDPGYADAWHNIGLWHEDRSQWAQAHDAFARALSSKPLAEMTLQLDAVALVRLGRAQEARQQLERAAAAAPTPGILATLGTVLDELGDHDAACRRYREALGKDPTLEVVRRRAATCP